MWKQFTKITITPPLFKRNESIFPEYQLNIGWKLLNIADCFVEIIFFEGSNRLEPLKTGKHAHTIVITMNCIQISDFNVLPASLPSVEEIIENIKKDSQKAWSKSPDKIYMAQFWSDAIKRLRKLQVASVDKMKITDASSV